jgi:hypothetical protein
MLPTTDAKGQFQMFVPPGPGKLILWGRAPGYVTFYENFAFGDPVDEQFVNLINADATKPQDDVVFKLQRVVSTKAKVADRDNGLPVNSTASNGKPPGTDRR